MGTIMLYSCTKENNEKIKIDTRERYLTQITEQKGSITTTTTFSYDDKMRLSTARTGSELISYSYTEDKLTGVDIKDGFNNTISEITYKDNYPYRGISKVYVSGILTRTLNYEYMSSLSQTGQINVSEPNTSLRRLYYEYDNANIISLVEIANRVFTNYDFEYGEKKNVFFNSNIRWPLGIDRFDRVSTNEVLSIKTETKGVKHQKSFLYSYDNDGFPLSAIVTETEPPSRTEYKSTIQYSYDYF